MGAARSGEQINLFLSSCVGSWERFPAFWAAVAGLWHSLATSLLQAEPALEYCFFFPKPFPLPPAFKGRGWMGALGSSASSPAPGRCCARSRRRRSAKGNTNILPKESTFHRQHRFPFFAQGRPVLGSFPQPHPRAEREPGRAFRAGLRPELPLPPHVRSTETSQRDHV